MEKKDNAIISLYSGSANREELEVTTIMRDNFQVQMRTFHQEEGVNHQLAIVASKGDEFLRTILGEDDVVKLLLTAVNNRTIERDYFKLYCEMLDSSITEEEFDKIIESNETDYVVNEINEPNDNQIKTALRLSDYIKGINSVNDFTALFSFNPKKIEAILEKSNG
ncbi:MAG: hypothetical protein LBO74_05115 [Candidatus Symbiothrix sp.]|jgi:hypothetical protein|nr:hypothetical protein [Candidatus Symbiothrix sp.]